MINVRKSILRSSWKIEFPGMKIDLIKISFSLATEKVQKVVKNCQNLLRSHFTIRLELTKVIGLLSSTTKAMKPTKIQLRFFSATAKCVSKRKHELSVSNETKHQAKNRIKFVDRELEVLQWPNWTHRWLFKQSATGMNHQGNGQRRKDPCI